MYFIEAHMVFPDAFFNLGFVYFDLKYFFDKIYFFQRNYFKKNCFMLKTFFVV